MHVGRIAFALSCGVALSLLQIGCQPSAPAQPVLSSSLAAEKRFSKLALSEQEQVWNEWLEDMREVVKITSNSDDRKILSFIEKNGTLVDSSQGTPPSLPSPKFHILVLDALPATQWEAEIGGGPEALARYNEACTALIVKKGPLPNKIRGTIGLHEGVHAYHWRAVSPKRVPSPQEHYEEELSAYLPQVRQFRAVYAPHYESLRQQIISLLRQDMEQWRAGVPPDKKSSEMGVLRVETVLPLLEKPALIEQAFTIPPGSDPAHLSLYLNFAFLDASFAVLDSASPTPEKAKAAKIAFLRRLTEESMRRP